MILSIGIGVYATGPVVKPGAFRTLDVAHAADRIGVEHADPAVGNLARRAGILSRNTSVLPLKFVGEFQGQAGH